MTESEYLELAKEVLSVCQKYETSCVLHKYYKVAKSLNVSKIHLSLPDAIAWKKEIKDFSLVGISTHSLKQLEDAQACGADYIFFGHVFPTDCKKGIPARGVESLQEICRTAKLPVYAIGGISVENTKEAIAAGASGVCVMSYGMQAKREAIEDFIRYCHGQHSGEKLRNQLAEADKLYGQRN